MHLDVELPKRKCKSWVPVNIPMGLSGTTYLENS